MRLLFTMLMSSDLGPVSRAIPIASELSQRGHEVVFSNPSAVPAKIITEAGFDNLPFRPSVTPRIWPEFSPRIWHVNGRWRRISIQ
jgi:UDP:flavonoid glycosyltransferase YjiC (YdhE family)